MSIYAGRGREPEGLHPIMFTKVLTFSSGAAGGETLISMGWLPANSLVIKAGAAVLTQFTAQTALDLGFRNSVQGLTADSDAFTETAIDLDTAVGYTEGDIISANNLPFTAPAEVVAALTLPATPTAGLAYAFVIAVCMDVAEDLGD